MMDFLTVDLPATKTLLENEDVVVETILRRKHQIVSSIHWWRNEKRIEIELDPGFTSMDGPLPKVRSFLKTLSTAKNEQLVSS